MTISRYDALDGIVLGIFAFMLVEGVLLIATARGLIDRLLPGRGLIGRLLGSLIYFLIAGVLFYSVWRR